MTMSIYVFFDERVLSLSGRFPVVDSQDGRFFYKGFLFLEKGSEYFLVLSFTDNLPLELEKLVKVYSIRHEIPYIGIREEGIYERGSARAVLTHDLLGRKETAELTGSLLGRRERYLVKVRGQIRNEVEELFEHIRIGDIRPDISFENPQGGKSRKELEAELLETEKQLYDSRSRIRYLLAELEHSKVKVADLQEENSGELSDECKKIQEFQSLVSDFRSRLWPLSLNSKVADQIGNVLKGK